jgi:hypothetical protein
VKIVFVHPYHYNTASILGHFEAPLKIIKMPLIIFSATLKSDTFKHVAKKYYGTLKTCHQR